MKPDQLELERLRREVTKKAERDTLKKPRPTVRRSLCEVRVHRETSRELADGVVMRGCRGQTVSALVAMRCWAPRSGRVLCRAIGPTARDEYGATS